MASSPSDLRRFAEYGWDHGASRWRDASTGRFVPPAKLREGVDALVDYTADRLRTLGTQYAAGSISLADFQSSLLQLIKSSQVASALVGYGGRESMTPARWGAVGQRVRVQYGYARDFVQAVGSGAVPDGRIPWRAALYANAAALTYESTLRREAKSRGQVQGRNVLHAKESCDQCKAIAAAGWQPAGQIPPVGARTCGARCRCTVEYRAASALSVAAAEPLQFFNPHHDARGRFAPGRWGTTHQPRSW